MSRNGISYRAYREIIGKIYWPVRFIEFLPAHPGSHQGMLKYRQLMIGVTNLINKEFNKVVIDLRSYRFYRSGNDFPHGFPTHLRDHVIASVDQVGESPVM